MKLKIFMISILCWVLQSCDNNNNVTGEYEKNDNWTKIESTVTETLYDIDFVDNKNGWIVGNAGIILHTEDGGNTWKKQACTKKGFLNAVDFVDNYYGWACGKDSILNTKDSGETWQLQYFQDLGEGYFRDIQFINKDLGFTVGGYGDFGSKGILLLTDDGGKNWRQLSENDLPTLTKISINKENIWICGFGGAILLSKDAGLTWEKKIFQITPLPSFTCIQFIDSLHGWVSSRDDWLGFFRSTDGGNTWIQRSKESLSIFGVNTFFFIDPFNGWLGTFPGAGYTIAKTTDGGQNWKFQQDVGISRIHSFYFLNRDKGWAVGLEGVILLYRNN